MITRRISRQTAGRKRAVGVDNPERHTTAVTPYEWVDHRIAVTVWTTIVNRQRKIAMHLKVRMLRVKWMPGSDDADVSAMGSEPSGIVLDGQGDTVEHRRKAIVKKSINAVWHSLYRHNVFLIGRAATAADDA